MFTFFKKIIDRVDQLFTVPLDKKEFTLKSYIEAIESGQWRDKIVLGILDRRKDYLTLDPVQAPGQMAIGGMGSGKSVAMRFTTATHIFCNSEKTLYVMVDPEKGMTDYKKFEALKSNVVWAVNSAEKFITVMDLLTQELEKRKEAFSKYGAKHIYEYEDLRKREDEKYQGLARIVLVFEEFHALVNNKNLNFHVNLERQGTTAGQFKNIMRIGRSFGFNVIIATQRATSDDVPSSIKPGLNTILAFRVNNPSDAAIANLPQAQDIRSQNRGRCAHEEGMMQFPYLTDRAQDELLKRFFKPLKAELLAKPVSDYHRALEGEGTEGLVWVKPLSQLLEAKGQFDPKDIARRILKEVEFETENQSNEALVANLIAERDQKRYAVVVVSEREDASPKAMANLKISLEQLGCTSVIGICLDFSTPEALRSIVRETSGLITDKEELKHFAKLLENKDKFDPEKFKERFLSFSLSRGAGKEESEEEDQEESDENFIEAIRRRRNQD